MSEQDLPEFPVNSRFHLLPLPSITPGKCAVCGSVERPVIDFMLNIDFYGAVLICTTCMSEAAQLLGMVPPEIHSKATEGLALHLTELLDLNEMVGVPRERYNDIVVAVSGLSDVLLFSGSSDNVMVAGPHGEVQQSLFGNPPETEQGPDGSPEQDDNTIVSEGPTSVSSSSKYGSHPTISD